MNVITSERVLCSAGQQRPQGAPKYRTQVDPLRQLQGRGFLALVGSEPAFCFLPRGCVISFVCSSLGLCPNLLSHVEYCWASPLWLGKSSPVRLQTQLRNQLSGGQEVQASSSQPDLRCTGPR